MAAGLRKRGLAAGTNQQTTEGSSDNDDKLNPTEIEDEEEEDEEAGVRSPSRRV